MYQNINMRVEITLPDDKKFRDNLQAILKEARRKRKNWIEDLVITAVNNSTVKTKTKQ